MPLEQLLAQYGYVMNGGGDADDAPISPNSKRKPRARAATAAKSEPQTTAKLSLQANSVRGVGVSDAGGPDRPRSARIQTPVAAGMAAKLEDPISPRATARRSAAVAGTLSPTSPRATTRASSVAVKAELLEEPGGQAGPPQLHPASDHLKGVSRTLPAVKV